MMIADVISLAALAPGALGVYCYFGVVRRGRVELTACSYAAFAVALWLLFIANAMTGDAFWATVDGLLAVVYTIAWWRNRRKGRGRKALKELGAKSRARVRSLVRRMTPSPIPSPAGARS